MSKTKTNPKQRLELPLQSASEDIYDIKYRLKDSKGREVDVSIADTLKRVAKAISKVERMPSLRRKWAEKFLWALENGAIPAGRILSNAGAEAYKPATSTINCTVAAPIADSMDSILDGVKRAGITLKAGCGIGYEFSTLRPKGAFVGGSGSSTSGPLPFMDIYDKMCGTVSSAGGRRGAQMGTFDIHHPDVLVYIKAKRETGRLSQFNLSVLITSDFMEAVKNDADWPLSFPANKEEIKGGAYDIVYRQFPIKDKSYTYDDNGHVACRVYKTLPARNIWNVIMTSTYDYAEPGFILIDAVNSSNNNWFCEDIRATNPCGEQPLPANGSCLLGSINLTKFVSNPFTGHAKFDWVMFSKVVSIFTRMLDNVVELNGLPLQEQRDEIERKRRHGMGFLGLGSTMAMLGVKYGSERSLEFTEKVTFNLAKVGYETGVLLAKEKGAAPIMNEDFIIDNVMVTRNPAILDAGFKIGQRVKGRDLWLNSSYIQKLLKALPEDDAEEMAVDLATVGCRFTHHSSIAPTGTISLSLANNASNGIEPSFAHHYSRNVIREGKKSKEKVDVFSYELLAYRACVDENAMPGSLPDSFISASDITPKQHVDVQASAQQWIDSSISKTANVPTDFPFEEFKNIYMYAYEKGLKGCTTFRFNPDVFQGVLVKNEDLENTTYRFTLEDGEVVNVKGNEMIEYDGETHTAANLFDALQSGMYGKY